MIFVTLGTQDKSFDRLLKAIDKEIEKGTIKDKVVVQAGLTKYESNNMEIFDLISNEEFDKLMSEADLVITHGGAGSILTALKHDKKVIAAARLKKFKEHTNDHQKEIIEEFVKEGYILGLNDFNKLDKMIEKSKNFKPKKYKSNTNNMINTISNYIEEDNHTSWYNKYSLYIKHTLLYGLLYFIISLLSNYINNNTINYIGILLVFIFISFFINKYILYKHSSGFISSIFLLIFYMISSYLIITFCSIISNIILELVVGCVLTYILNRYIVFRGLHGEN